MYRVRPIENSVQKNDTFLKGGGGSMLSERQKNRLVDIEAAKLTAKYGIKDSAAYEAVKAIIGRYESEVRKQQKRLSAMH